MEDRTNPPAWLTEPEAAHHLRVSPDTLRRWRREGTGPDWHRAGGRLIRYRLTEVDAWVTGSGEAAR
ncbi:helix-turn-helix transcriptional regulator [Nocardiopsis valliformis]|uniref:helix-turn-helix transcriptional regulator n=1 Tax=Nocardiopsis valliformis TaxID=239974 RepID=UPI00034B28EF|nr:helix-turn-helix domain-containing protein [Nocardiopsis valliformis]